MSQAVTSWRDYDRYDRLYFKRDQASLNLKVLAILGEAAGGSEEEHSAGPSAVEAASGGEVGTSKKQQQQGKQQKQQQLLAPTRPGDGNPAGLYSFALVEAKAYGNWSVVPRCENKTFNLEYQDHFYPAVEQMKEERLAGLPKKLGKKPTAHQRASAISFTSTLPKDFPPSAIWFLPFITMDGTGHKIAYLVQDKDGKEWKYRPKHGRPLSTYKQGADDPFIGHMLREGILRGKIERTRYGYMLGSNRIPGAREK